MQLFHEKYIFNKFGRGYTPNKIYAIRYAELELALMADLQIELEKNGKFSDELTEMNRFSDDLYFETTATWGDQGNPYSDEFRMGAENVHTPEELVEKCLVWLQTGGADISPRSSFPSIGSEDFVISVSTSPHSSSVLRDVSDTIASDKSGNLFTRIKPILSKNPLPSKEAVDYITRNILEGKRQLHRTPSVNPLPSWKDPEFMKDIHL